MTIQELGSLGEFVASIGVVASLIVLTIQITRNTRELKQNYFQDVFQAYSNIRRSIYTNPELSSLISKIRAESDITEEEKLRFESYVNELSWCLHQLGNLVQSGQIQYDEDSWAQAKNFLLIELNTSVGKLWWNQNKTLYQLPFREEIDIELASA